MLGVMRFLLLSWWAKLLLHAGNVLVAAAGVLIDAGGWLHNRSMRTADRAIGLEPGTTERRARAAARGELSRLLERMEAEPDGGRAPFAPPDSWRRPW